MFNERTVLIQMSMSFKSCRRSPHQSFPTRHYSCQTVFFNKKIPADDELFVHISEQTGVSEIVDMSYVHRRVSKLVLAETVTM